MQKRHEHSRATKAFTMSLPCIVFWDVDKTMIGYADAACDRYWLMRHLQNLEDSHVLPRGTCPSPLIDARREIEPLLRPGLRAGLDAIRAALSPRGAAEFFVCSYGKECVLEDLKVRGIEEAIGPMFNRPIFCVSSDQARNVQPACGKKVKLIRKNFDEAARSLVHKHPALEDPAVVDEVFRTRFFMVDDTEGIAFDAASNERVIVCPAFEHRPAPSADPLEGLRIPSGRRSYLARQRRHDFLIGDCYGSLTYVYRRAPSLPVTTLRTRSSLVAALTYTVRCLFRMVTLRLVRFHFTGDDGLVFLGLPPSWPVEGGYMRLRGRLPLTLGCELPYSGELV
jgi:hypothetical protein